MQLFLFWITPVSVVQFIIQMFKLNGLGKTHRERLCSRTENFARPFTTDKLFERIQILNEWKFHRLIQLQPNTSRVNFLGTFCERLKSMNELSVIGSLCLRTDLWDCHGKDIATHHKEMYGERLFRRPKKRF